MYCSPCHDRTGRAAAWSAALPTWKPTNLQETAVKDMTDGEIFNMITHGTAHDAAVPVSDRADDRWAIVAYVRALQRTTTGDVGRCSRKISGRLAMN